MSDTLGHVHALNTIIVPYVTFHFQVATLRMSKMATDFSNTLDRLSKGNTAPIKTFGCLSDDTV